MRITALGKYLASLSKYLHGSGGKARDDPTGTPRQMLGRSRLHFLYLLNDILHHTKYHNENSSQFSTFSGSIQPFLVDLFQLASSASQEKVRKRLEVLLGIWQEEQYYSRSYIDKLREVVTTAMTGEPSSIHDSAISLPPRADSTRDPPFTMPATHGDPSVPYYDLPAGNFMPHILPNSSVPVRPDQVKALHFVAGPAEENLVHAVKAFLKEIEMMDGGNPRTDEGITTDIDDLGQIFYKDELGEQSEGDTYYGWSRTFCEQMKRRRNGRSGKLSRRRSYSSSRSSSRSPRKRRRYSGSSSVRSNSTSRSRSPYGLARNQTGHAAHLRHEPRHRPMARSRSLSRSRSRSSSMPYSPPLQPDAAIAPINPSSQSSAQISPPPYPTNQPYQAHPRPADYNQQAPPPTAIATSLLPESLRNVFPNMLPFQPPLGPNGLPIPPPRPPNYDGPWPPPPPPLPQSTMQYPPAMPFQPLAFQQGGNSGATQPPIPPGPGPVWERGQNKYWRGGR